MAGLEMRYFVLSPMSGDPSHRKASRAAIRRYVHLIRFDKPELAKDLLQWVDNIESPTGNVEFEKTFDRAAGEAARTEELTQILARRSSEGVPTMQRGPLISEATHMPTVQQPEPPVYDPAAILEEPPEGWIAEKDARTTHPTGYLVRTDDGTRKWHTDPMFKQVPE